MNLNDLLLSDEIFFSLKKHNWNYSKVSNFHYVYNDEIADYYLNIVVKKNDLRLLYTLDLEFSKNRHEDLLYLLNLVNKIHYKGSFKFILKSNSLEYEILKVFPQNTYYNIILDFIQKNSKTNLALLKNFSFLIHNLSYADTYSLDLIKLMFQEIHGHA